MRYFWWLCAFVLLALPACNAPVERRKAAVCGNGIVEAREACDPAIQAGEDGACPTTCAQPSNPCSAVVLFGAAETCDAFCVVGEPACGLADGCCPAECSGDADLDCNMVCGEGIVACEAGDGCCPPNCGPDTDSDCDSTCGDGVVNGPETCDGNCPGTCDDGDACTTDFVVGEPSTCDVECMTAAAISACVSGDGCCPPICNRTIDTDCPCDPSAMDCCSDITCEAWEACDSMTGHCNVANCPNENPTQCAGTSEPFWDPTTCRCSGCLSDADCIQGETCHTSGVCFACQQACDGGTPGTCQGQTPYCVNDCCVECIGVTDCALDEVCLDGVCGGPPNCLADPFACPIGYSCDASGTCQSPQGAPCSASDRSCPDGTYCDSVTSICLEPGGILGCGECNPDCTCDSGLSCDGFFGCSECSPAAQDCAAGAICVPVDAASPLGAGMCTTGLCADLCPGCCTGESCVVRTTDAACGNAGASCEVCMVPEVCWGGTCSNPAETWDVVLVSAQIPSSKLNGAAWDPAGGLPDPFAEMFAEDTARMLQWSGFSQVVYDSLTPSWNKTVLVAVSTEALLAGLRINLNDDEIATDVICDEVVAVDAAMVSGMDVTTTCTADPRVTITWRIQPTP